MSGVLSRLSFPDGARHAEKRVGRGPGSGVGKTCGRGVKGQKARHGGNFGKLHFQGGQTPIQRRLPKRGFRVPFPTRTVTVSIADLERFDANSVVDEAVLRDARLVQGQDVRIKVLSDGELTKALTVKVHGFSNAAVEKIQQAGGKAVFVDSDEAKAEQTAS